MRKHIHYIRALVSGHGPTPPDYPDLDAWYSDIHRQFSDGDISLNDLMTLRNAFGDAMSTATLQGLAWIKPHGYAGDFEIIDKIYQEYASEDLRLTRWDEYLHHHPSSHAVRNRRRYFSDAVQGKERTHSNGALRILIIGSGPGREIFDYLSMNADSHCLIDCVDNDRNAINYAKSLNKSFLDRISFIHKNALRFRPSHIYDLIWAAGIFDYFSDEIFRFLARRFISCLSPGGEIIIGNFSPENPSRAYMEFSDWRLTYRSSDELIALAMQCWAPPDHITIGSEPQGVNLFLHVRNWS